jgi:hypothetical protein
MAPMPFIFRFEPVVQFSADRPAIISKYVIRPARDAVVHILQLIEN